MRAIEAFDATIERAETLFSLHSTGAAGRPRKEKEDILRATIMLAIAGVDAYFHDKVLERITPFMKMKKGRHLPGDLLELLRGNGGIQKLLEIMYEQRPHRHIHTLVKNVQADKTFQKPDKIEGALRLVGINDFWFKVAQRMGRGASKEGIKRKVGQYAHRRDKIGHEADRSGAGRLNHISRPYVRECLSFVQKFIHSADQVIDEGTGGT